MDQTPGDVVVRLLSYGVAELSRAAVDLHGGHALRPSSEFEEQVLPSTATEQLRRARGILIHFRLSSLTLCGDRRKQPASDLRQASCSPVLASEIRGGPARR